jgi:hypothetical protein
MAVPVKVREVPVVGPSGVPSEVKPSVSTTDLMEMEERALETHPGRVAGYEAGPPPEPESTPWLSLVYVNARHSACGHAYAIGDAVCEVEAERQGLLEPSAEEVFAARKVKAARRPCGRCQGRGMYSRTRPPGHRKDCSCRFCGPCPRCGGTRYEPDEEESDG